MEYGESVRTGSTRQHARRLWVAAAALSVGVVISGAALVANESQLGGHAAPSLDSDPTWAVADASEVLPGAPVITLLGTRVSTEVEGSAVIDLGIAPDGATHVRIAVTCLSAGTIGWGFDPTNTPSMTCSEADVPNTGWEDVPLTGSTELHVLASDSVISRIDYQYASHRPTEFGTNAAGETYGIQSDGIPDLVAVIGVDDAGNRIEGYARSGDLTHAGLPQPQNPDEAGEYMEQVADLRLQYPDGFPVPVFESDGVTRIGTFYVGL